MDDAQLVEAARVGDRNAYAAVYDRYADRIHDFCASILRNRAEAADALQETFLVAFSAIDRLAEPARLRSWLYALAHRAVRDRLESRGPYFAGDEVDLNRPLDERPSRADLTEFIGRASAGLPTEDRVLLDLHLRQGLEGRDLAGAAGVPAPLLEARLPRLEAQAGRALGALLVARSARRICPVLAAMVGAEDGPLTAEFRDRATAHVDDCERCNSQRRIAPNPLDLLAAAPLAPVPAYLRNVVLGKAELSELERDEAGGRDGLAARAGWEFHPDGFPDLAATATGGRRPAPAPTGPVLASTRRGGAIRGPGPAGAPTARGIAAGRAAARRPERQDRRAMLVGALAGLIILVAAVVVVTSHRGATTLVGVSTTTTTTVGVAATTAIVAPTVTTVPVAVATTTTLPTSTVAPTGHLIVATKTLDLGLNASSAILQVGNDGLAVVNFTAMASGTGLTVTPGVGSLAPGASQALTVALDRSAPPPGTFIGSILIASHGGNPTVAVTAMVDPGPAISGETPLQATVSPTTCTVPTHPTTIAVTASVTGPQPLRQMGVVLHWQSTTAVDSMGRPAWTASMTMSGTIYTGALGPFTTPGGMAGTVDWWITAIDTAGATSTSMHNPLAITCP